MSVPKSQPSTEGPELVFVYNASGGLWSALGDALHKLVSPHTYPCSLCALTYGSVRMRPQWRRFIAGLGVSVRFLHVDELKRAHGDPKEPLPAVFVRRRGRLEPWLSKAAIDECRTLEALEQLVLDTLAANHPLHHAA